MKRFGIDTHALVWYLSRPRRLGRDAARVLRDADAGHGQILIPAIVLIELQLLRESGRDVIGPAQVEALVLARPNFRVLPLDADQAREFCLIGALEDPFDRLVVAATRTASARLLSADAGIEESGLVETVWS